MIGGCIFNFLSKSKGSKGSFSFKSIFQVICLASVCFSTNTFSSTLNLSSNKIIMGRVEKVMIFSKKIPLEAKLDTGAYSSSLSAIDIREIEEDGEEWVSFNLVGDQEGELIPMKLPLFKHVQIKKRRSNQRKLKNSNDEKVKVEWRPVVVMPICLGTQLENLEINLTDRRHFNYSMLLGRDAIRAFGGVVDVTKTHRTHPNCEAKADH